VASAKPAVYKKKLSVTTEKKDEGAEKNRDTVPLKYAQASSLSGALK
jgi:hypothetical protein